mgnify:CR=1 FL=1
MYIFIYKNKRTDTEAFQHHKKLTIGLIKRHKWCQTRKGTNWAAGDYWPKLQSNSRYQKHHKLMHAIFNGKIKL